MHILLKKMKILARLLLLIACGVGSGSATFIDSVAAEKCAPPFFLGSTPYTHGSSVSATISFEERETNTNTKDKEKCTGTHGCDDKKVDTKTKDSSAANLRKFNFICHEAKLCNSRGYEPGTLQSDQAWTMSEYACSIVSSIHHTLFDIDISLSQHVSFLTSFLVT